MLSEIVDVIEVLVFSNREPYASLRTIALVLLLAWIIGRLVSRWFEEKPAGKGGGGGGGPQQKQEQPKGSGGKQQQPKGGGGGGGGAIIKPSFLEGILAGIGAGVGATLAGLGAGLGGVVRGIGGAIGDVGRGRSGGQHYLGGTRVPQAGLKQPSNSGAWKGAAVGLGVGLGLGAAAASWAKGQTASATGAARAAWQGWQAQREWNAWHSQGAPAYGWGVADPAAAQVMSEAFDAAGVRYAWQETPEGWQVVINAEDLQMAEQALDAVVLEFQEMGQPIGADGEPWEPGVNDWCEQDPKASGGTPGEASVWDEETGQWVPVAEPAGPEPSTPWQGFFLATYRPIRGVNRRAGQVTPATPVVVVRSSFGEASSDVRIVWEEARRW